MSIVNIDSMSQLSSYLCDNNQILIDYYADWCGPCKRLIDHVSKNFLTQPKFSNLVIIKINIDNIDEFKELMELDNVTSIPHLVAYKNQVKIGHVVGSKIPEVTSLLESLL